MSERIGPVEYDVETNTYRVRYDPEAVPPSVAVIELVEGLADEESSTLTPLYDVVDPEAFDTIVQAARSKPHPHRLTVSFRYQNLVVTAFGDGVLEVTAADDDRSSDG